MGKHRFRPLSKSDIHLLTSLTNSLLGKRVLPNYNIHLLFLASDLPAPLTGSVVLLQLLLLLTVYQSGVE